jgi:hypothetical protein
MVVAQAGAGQPFASKNVIGYLLLVICYWDKPRFDHSLSQPRTNNK